MSVLSDLPKDYHYLFVNRSDSEIVIKVKNVLDEASVKVWLEKYSDCTKSTWRKERTYPNAGRYNLFRTDLRCTHLTDKRVKGIRSSKNTGCPAKLQIVVKRPCDPKNSTAAENEHLTTITRKNNHNHENNTAATLRYRDLSQEIKDKFSSLFRQGYTPAAALNCHKLDLMIEHGETYYEVAADGKFMPTLSVVTNLFQKEFAHNYGDFNGEKMFETLQEMLKDYNKTGGKADFNYTKDGQHYYITLCTPTMLRVHEKVIQAGELVMIDASGGVDKQRHRIYFIVTPCCVGGLPLGVIITDAEKESVFTEALQCFMNMIKSHTAFFGKKEPKVIITDNDLKEINGLNRVFPNSIKLLCQFHVLKAMWSWLCNAKHNILKQHRQELYFMFRKLMYSQTEEAAEKNYKSLCLLISSCKYSNLLKHLDEQWAGKQKWITCFRNTLPLRGNNTTNYVEVVFRILKDCVFERTMAFNLNQLVDFIVTRYEMYVKQRLIDFCNGRYSLSLLRKMVPFKIDTSQFVVQDNLNNDVYTVNHMNKSYTVDLLGGMCTCFSGKTGKLCIHSSAVILSQEDNYATSYNVVSNKIKCDMFYIAEGTNPPKSWFLPLNAVESENCTSVFNDNATENPILPENTADTCKPSCSVANENAQSFNEPKYSINDLNSKILDVRKLFERIERGLLSNPNVFMPAVESMLKKEKLYAKTESGLVSALYTFGSYAGYSSIKKKISSKLVRRSHKQMIGVQPTALGRRKLCITGKRKVAAGRPSKTVKSSPALASHDYTTFGALPASKRKAPHDLEKCVHSNKSLGGTKRAKY